jgi:G:T/U-mismatch repair DNA glycosylase
MLSDLLAYDLKLVICGTAAGNRSAELKQYYAKPGNKFWPTFAQGGLRASARKNRQYSAFCGALNQRRGQRLVGYRSMARLGATL